MPARWQQQLIVQSRLPNMVLTLKSLDEKLETLQGKMLMMALYPGTDLPNMGMLGTALKEVDEGA